MLLMIDNYDSFTYNVVQYLAELGENVVVHRNDEITLQQIRDLNPDKIVLSPGPCTPDQAGVSMDVIREFGADKPLLGICLGHQSIGQVFGGCVVRAKAVMHGKTSNIHHNGVGMFRTLDNPIVATRYHSLVVEANTLPDVLEVTAWTERDGERDEVMGVRHKTLPIEGVQFHPESILTPDGHNLLNNFLTGY